MSSNCLVIIHERLGEHELVTKTGYKSLYFGQQIVLPKNFSHFDLLSKAFPAKKAEAGKPYKNSDFTKCLQHNYRNRPLGEEPNQHIQSSALIKKQCFHKFTSFTKKKARDSIIKPIVATSEHTKSTFKTCKPCISQVI